MNKNKRVLSAAMAIIMSTAVLPLNTFANGVNSNTTSVVAASRSQELPLDLQKTLADAEKFKVKLQNFQSGSEKNIASILELSKSRIAGANTAADVLKQAEKAKEDAAKLMTSSVRPLITEGEGIVRRLEKYKSISEVNVAIANLNGAIGMLKSENNIVAVNAQIDGLAQKRINELQGKSNEIKDRDSEVDRIIDKIKDADSFEEIDDIKIPDYLKYNSDILKAKSDRRADLTDDIKSNYSDYRKEDKLDVRRIRIESDRDNRGKWIVEGYADDHIREYVSVFYDGRFVGGGTTDGEGYFEITVSEEVRDNSSLEFFAGNQKYFEKDEVRISPWDLKISTYYVEGKYNKETSIKMYYRGRYAGEGRTDSDGKFRIKSNEQIVDKDELKFYSVNKSSNDSKVINITSAKAGETKITGTSSSYAEIIVKDNDNIRLGNVKADYNGNFNIFLNRALKNGEVLKFTITDKDREDVTMEYTVSGLQSGNMTRISYVKGYPNGHFKAGANISRAEAVMMFGRLINGSENFNTKNTTKFEDAETGWYAQAINFSVDNGLMKGYPNGDFEPDSYITRAEFAEMVSRYVKKQNPGNTNLNDINNHWAKNAIETLYGNKIIKGYPDGTFKPEENITRAEAVTVLNAAFDRKSTKDSMENISNPEMLITFNDVRKADWYYAEVLDAANAHDSYRSGNTDIWTFVK